MKIGMKIIILIVCVLLLVGCSKRKSEIRYVNLNKTKIEEFEKLQLTIPEIFKKSNESTDSFVFYSIQDDKKKLYDYSFCSIELLKTKYYSSNFEDEIKQELSENYFQEYEIKKKKINGKEWLYAIAKSKETENTYYTETVYFTEHDNLGYFLEMINFMPEEMSCDKLFNQTRDSLKFK